ncbi:hypothetical protein C5167_033844 [Papaver somniferum]|uniref:Uncharacterized protein n=1 Tax=Papaver somniferum TaxID=3469 RepID=A0A4Y7KFN2_PAPSO|nr:beta-glucuronosyltransferase GlcAT14A-like [Papaver somniferum]RZC70715.1 hypothetical protein C5167_033844 [Papaver somniferum]
MGIKKFMIPFILAASIIFCVIIIVTLLLTNPIDRFQPVVKPTLTLQSTTDTQYPVAFAYLISSSKGDLEKLKRVLFALYHPNNYYLLHMDQGAPKAEHFELAKFISEEPVFSQIGNVWIVGKPNLVTYRGPTMLATTLHAMSLLLRSCKWDWFINLSASDYPLITQDDLIHSFSKLPKHLNFIQHSSRLGWKLNKRGKPIMIDPGLYSLNKSEIWWVIKQRSLPTSFKLYTGSAWTILSRSFAEYCITGWDNLPRTLLLYYTNLVSSPEGYFQTLVCNSEYYKNTVVSHDLHFIAWDNPPKQHPKSLGIKYFKKMIQRNVTFARKFKQDDPALDKIDRELLRRERGEFSYGGWCFEGNEEKPARSTCSSLKSENFGVLKPGPGSIRLDSLLTEFCSDRNIRRQCR